jgi:hypothetical protein
MIPGDDMPRLTPQAAEVLDKALALSSDERGLLIDRLVESLEDEPAVGALKQLGRKRSSAGSMKLVRAR